MASINRGKIETVKNILKKLHEGVSVDQVKAELKRELAKIQPFEIPLIEQELVTEGIPVAEILKLCGLHVEALRDLNTADILKDRRKTIH